MDTTQPATTMCADTSTRPSATTTKSTPNLFGYMSPNLPTATEDISIFYDKAMLPGIYIEGRAIKPDSVIWDKKIKEANIIEVSVPNDFGLNRAERHKVNKYQDPKNDFRQTLELENIDIIPVIVGATGLIKTNLKNYLKDIPGSPSVEEIQMCAITGTVSIIKRALSH